MITEQQLNDIMDGCAFLTVDGEFYTYSYHNVNDELVFDGVYIDRRIIRSYESLMNDEEIYISY